MDKGNKNEIGFLGKFGGVFKGLIVDLFNWKII